MAPLPRNVFDILLAACLLLVLGLSLVGEPGITGDIPGAVFWVGGFLCMTSAFRVESYHRCHPAVILSVLLLLWSCVSSLVSLDRYLSDQCLTTLICSVGVLCTTIYLGRRFRWFVQLKTVAVVMVLCALVEAWSAELSLQSSHYRLSGDFTNPNTLAVLLLMSTAIALSLYANQNRGLDAFRLFAVTVLSLSLLMTLSRSATAGLLVLLALGVLAIKQGRSLKLSSPKVVIAALAILLIGSLLPLGIARPLLDRASSALNSPNDIPVRQELVHGSLRCGLQNPVLGSGPGTFQLMFQTVRPVNTPVQELANSAHNDPLQFLVETGTPGFLLWLAMLGSVIFYTPIKTDLRRAFWLPAGVIGIFVVSLFNFVVPVATTCLWFFFLIGLAAAESPARSGLKLDSRGQLVLSVSLIFLGSFALLSSGFRSVSESALDRAESALEEDNCELALSALDRGLTYSAHDSRLWLLKARTLEELFRAHPSTKYGVEAERSLWRAWELSPNNLQTLRTGANISFRRGDYERALLYYQRAFELAPYHDKTRVRLAQLLAFRGNPEEAVALLLVKPKTFNRYLVPLLMATEEREPGRLLVLLEGLEPKELIDFVDPLKEAALNAGNRTLLLGIHRLTRGSRAKDSVERDSALAENLLALGDRVTARELLRSAVAEENSTKVGYSEALVLWSKFGDTEVIPRLERFLNSHPDDSRVRLALSEHLEPKKAVDLINEGLNRQPRNSAMLHQMGVLFERQGMKEIADEYFRDSRKVRR
jgi:O-antigen ligase/uncharacterized protein HemY